MSKQQKTVSVEIICADDARHKRVDPGGWGDGATCDVIIGKAMEIALKRNGEVQFTLRLYEDGSLMFTSHECNYTAGVGQTYLTNRQPWKNRKPKTSKAGE